MHNSFIAVAQNAVKKKPLFPRNVQEKSEGEEAAESLTRLPEPSPSMVSCALDGEGHKIPKSLFLSHDVTI